MGKFIDLTGQRFGRLKVISLEGINKQGNKIWQCVCECGNKNIFRSGDLRSGHTKSCGCFMKEQVANTQKTHGLSESRIYNIWSKMKQRCLKPSCKEYKFYGARGVKICDRWHKFENFREDMGNSYKNNLSIERRNNNGDYTPENCCWISPTRQARNRRNNLFYTHSGIKKCVAEWAEETGLNYGTLISRIRRGWSIEKALTKPIN